VRIQPTFTALQAARQRQQTPEFKDVYAKRAGIEGTFSQGVRAFGLRRSRSMGEAKTRLQHLMIAGALPIVRLFACSEERPQEHTCCSRVAALAPASLAVAGRCIRQQDLDNRGHFSIWDGKQCRLHLTSRSCRAASVSTSLRFQDMLWSPLPFGSREVP
jgi:hypothetical protein